MDEYFVFRLRGAEAHDAETEIYWINETSSVIDVSRCEARITAQRNGSTATRWRTQHRMVATQVLAGYCRIVSHRVPNGRAMGAARRTPAEGSELVHLEDAVSRCRLSLPGRQLVVVRRQERTESYRQCAELRYVHDKMQQRISAKFVQFVIFECALASHRPMPASGMPS
jgi:hypothetical protein